MKVYSLLGFMGCEGASDLVGVFGSVEDVMKCVMEGADEWYFDEMGYVESEVGEKIDSVKVLVQYVKLVPHSYKKVVG